MGRKACILTAVVWMVLGLTIVPFQGNASQGEDEIRLQGAEAGLERSFSIAFKGFRERRQAAEKPAEAPERPEGAERYTISEQQKKNVDKIVQDLQQLKSGSEVTDEQRDQLAKALKTLVEGTSRPSEESVDALASSILEVAQDGELSPAEMKELMGAVAVVMDSANVSQEEVDDAVAAAKEVLEASGVDKEDAQLIVSDLQAIAGEAKASAPAQVQQNMDDRRQAVQERLKKRGLSKE